MISIQMFEIVSRTEEIHFLGIIHNIHKVFGLKFPRYDPPVWLCSLLVIMVSIDTLIAVQTRNT